MLRDGFRKCDDGMRMHLSERIGEDSDPQGRPESVAGEAERRNYVLSNKTSSNNEAYPQYRQLRLAQRRTLKIYPSTWRYER
jgi:hypothetical protein